MRPKVILFGDSITQQSYADGGWGASLTDLFCRRIDFVLRGYSGYNTRWAIHALDRIISSQGSDAPIAVTVFFGANDASLPDRSSGFQHVPLVEYKQNLSSIVSSIKIDFVLRGYSGYNTRWAIHALDRIISSQGSDAPIAVTVFFGANDASLPDRSSGFQHVPLVEYRQNLSSIVSSIKKRWPTTLVLLITPPPIDEDGRVRFFDSPAGQPERTNEAAGAYARECCKVAAEHGIPVVDLWSKMQQFPDWEKSCLSDGLHLTPSGNKIVFNEVVEKLKQEGLSLETLPLDLPLFMDIDPMDPSKALQN